MEIVAPVSKRPSCILWSEIEKWTPESVLLRFGRLPDGWRLLPVSAFAAQVENKEKVKPESEYRMAGVRWYGEGVFHRETVVGKEQSANYLYPLKPGAIIYNRLFAWKESFAVVPEELDGFYVSNEFPQFEIDQAIALPKYIYLLFNTKKIIGAVNAASIGSAAISRNRFKESDFLGFKVPMPPLPDQRKIVAHWEAAQTFVQRNHEAISCSKHEAFDIFRKTLGIKMSSIVRPKLFTARWREVERWGHELAWRNKNGANSFVYPVKPLKEVCKTGSGGTPSRKHKEYYGGETYWVKTTEVRNAVIYDAEEKITSKGLTSSSAKLYPAGSLVIAMYGQGATRGRTAKLGVDAATNQACLVLTEIDPSLDTDFLWYYLMVSYDEMRGLASGNNQPNLSADLLGGFPIPIPPIAKQAELKSLFEIAQQKVAELEGQSAQIRNQTTRDIEKMILGTRPAEVH
jgi:type I restriction enzyme S subunit